MELLTWALQSEAVMMSQNFRVDATNTIAPFNDILSIKLITSDVVK